MLVIDKNTILGFLSYSNETDCPDTKVIIADENGNPFNVAGDLKSLDFSRDQIDDPLIRINPNLA